MTTNHPTNFADLFREDANDGNRNTHATVAGHLDPSAANTLTGAALVAGITGHPENMCLLRVSTQGHIEVLHHIRQMPTPLANGGANAGSIVAISGDVDPNVRAVNLVEVDESLVQRATAGALQPTPAHLTALLANQVGEHADDLVVVPPNQVADNDWVQLPSRRTTYAPQWVAAMVIGQDLTPAAAWRTVGAAVQAHPDAGEFGILLNWLAAACVEGAVAGRSRVAHTDPDLVRMEGLVARDYAPVLKGCLPEVFDPAAQAAAAVNPIIPAMQGVANAMQTSMTTTANAIVASKTNTVEDKFKGGLGAALIRTHSQDASQLPPPYTTLKDYAKGEDRVCLQEYANQFAAANGYPEILFRPAMRDAIVQGHFNAGPPSVHFGSLHGATPFDMPLMQDFQSNQEAMQALQISDKAEAGDNIDTETTVTVAKKFQGKLVGGPMSILTYTLRLRAWVVYIGTIYTFTGPEFKHLVDNLLPAWEGLVNSGFMSGPFGLGADEYAAYKFLIVFYEEIHEWFSDQSRLPPPTASQPTLNYPTPPDFKKLAAQITKRRIQPLTYDIDPAYLTTPTPTPPGGPRPGGATAAKAADRSLVLDATKLGSRTVGAVINQHGPPPDGKYGVTCGLYHFSPTGCQFGDRCTRKSDHRATHADDREPRKQYKERIEAALVSDQ